MINTVHAVQFPNIITTVEVFRLSFPNNFPGINLNPVDVSQLNRNDCN